MPAKPLPGPELDTDALVLALDIPRRILGWSWPRLGQEIGVSHCTFDRLKNGTIPQGTTLLRMLLWLELSGLEDIRQFVKGE